MSLLPPFPEPVTFEEVAAILDKAGTLIRGGPPYVIGAAGWHLAAALDARAFGWCGRRPMRDSLPFSVREMPDGVHDARRRETLIRLRSAI